VDIKLGDELCSSVLGWQRSLYGRASYISVHLLEVVRSS
jgi:hypothetical protein